MGGRRRRCDSWRENGHREDYRSVGRRRGGPIFELLGGGKNKKKTMKKTAESEQGMTEASSLEANAEAASALVKKVTKLAGWSKEWAERFGEMSKEKKTEMKEKERRAVEEMRDVLTRVRTNTMAVAETHTMAAAETNTMAVAETDTMAAAERDTTAEREAVATAAVEQNVEVAEKDDEERAQDGAGWENEKTYRKYSEYWNDPRWNQKWTG